MLIMIHAVLLIIERDGKVLFGKRTKQRESIPNRWSLPSEKVEGDDSMESAVRRCADNELGVVVNDIVEFEVFHYNDGIEDKVLRFLKIDVEGEPFLNNLKELSELKWMSFEEFFGMYEDSEIGHGLQYLRKKLELD